MRCLTVLIAVLGLLESTVATAWIGSTTPSPTIKRADDAANGNFVTVENGQFMRNGQPFFYFGTNAYWLAHLSDENLNLTMKSIADRNITVVRTWAFNDVTTIPTSGAWFQLLLPNGSAVINTGASGFGRLEAILNAAEANNLLVQFTLTNNWNPVPNATATLTKRANSTEPPRGSLSNDYGGMDAYVRAHNLTAHDQFYTNQTLINAFQNYLNALIPQFANRTSLLAWELANDPRCNSTVSDSGQCLSANITRWHATISSHIKTLDSNHVLTSGTSGFQCMSQNTTQCQKLFPIQTQGPPPPRVSPIAGQKRHMDFSERGILSERKARYKRNAEALQHRAASAAEKRKRGYKTRWSYRGKSVEESNLLKRQMQQNVQDMSATDGTQRVDSQDISNIPDIGFATAQLFPDQNTYESPMPSLDAFNNTLGAGVAWIMTQAAAAQQVNKPLALTAFGLVSQDNLPFFVPFNSSQPLFPNATANPTATSTSSVSTPTPTPLGIGVEQGQAALTDQQQADIYQAWIQAAIDNDVQGIVQYQWGQTQLAPPQQQVTTAPEDQNTFSPSLGQQGVSPNDGYQSISSAVQDVLQVFAIQQNLRNIQLADAFPGL